MARKVASKKKLREEAEASEKAPKKKAKKKAAKKKKSVKKETTVRLKAFWGVFNQSLKRIAIFEYHERKKADKKASDLCKSGKTSYFVQMVKEVIQEEEAS